VVDGEVAPISAFRHLPRGKRPRAICPVCDCEVVFVLGSQTAHHFRHGEGSDCPVKGGETAEHLNTKFYIADVLRRALSEPANRRALRVVEECVGVPEVGLSGCPSRGRFVFAQAWDEVRVERGLAELRPDILLFKDGAPLVAIEVLRTHAVGDEKAVRLAELDVRWIEVPAGEEIYAGERPWSLAQPIPTLRIVPGFRWSCKDCTRIQREHAESQRRGEEERQYRQRLRRRAVRVVDFYSRRKGCTRAMVTLGAEYESDELRSVALAQESTGRILARVRVRAGPNARRAAWTALEARFAAWRDFRVQHGSYADEASGGWVFEEELGGRDPEEAFPRRYARDGDGWTPGWVGVPPMPGWLRPSAPSRSGFAKMLDTMSAPAGTAFASAWAHGTIQYFVRVVDWYSNRGECVRNTLRRYVWPGQAAGIYFGALHWAAGESPPVSAEGPSAAACEEALDSAYRALTEVEEATGCALDSPMRWIPGTDAPAEASAAWPQRMAWSRAADRWVRRHDYDRIRWDLAAPPIPGAAPATPRAPARRAPSR
jgi:hypothetical protein